ncbi:MAG TPA: FtsK/SpoIIIE domain-containing protein [Pyrinomonadaceae bacterium]|nr:FtsK/SpoIIIE domain-containing protein [Pyrinomonadaceae bacterium]
MTTTDTPRQDIPPQLEWLAGPLLGQATELTADYMIVGREADCCRVLVEVDVVSRRHAALEVSASGEVTVVDLASSNGTHVNGERVNRRTLSDGDRIRFGPLDSDANCVFRAARAWTRGEVPRAADGLSVARADQTPLPSGVTTLIPSPLLSEPPRPNEEEDILGLDDEPLFEFSTDKVDAEIPSPAAGKPREVRFKEGDTVEVNTVVAVVSEGAVAAAIAEDPKSEVMQAGASTKQEEAAVAPKQEAAAVAAASGKSEASSESATGESSMSQQQPAREQSTAEVRDGAGPRASGNGRPAPGVRSDARPDDFPARMRELVHRIDALTASHDQRRVAIVRRREAALQTAAQKLDSAKKRLESEAAANDGALKSAEAEARKLTHALESKRSAADSHLKRQGVRAAAAPSRARHVRDAGEERGLDEAKRRLQEVARQLSDLTGTKKPENSGGMFVAFALVGIVISIFAAVSVSRDSAAILFVLINLLFSGAGAVIALVRSSSAASAMQERYKRLLREAEVVKGHLAGYVKHVKTQHGHAHSDVERRVRQAHDEQAQEAAAAERAYKSELEEFEQRARAEADELRAACAAFYAETGFAGLDWGEDGWQRWDAADSLMLSARVGSLTSPRSDFRLPAMLSFGDERGGRCLLFNATGAPKERANLAVQSLMLRLLANAPPGKVLFTLIDPVGLGQNVASFMPLADFEEKLITSRAWTEPRHIEEQLSKLTEHMENVIQKYLRNDYPTIEDYNRSAGEVAEPYRVLVVHDFPVNFSDAAARRLVSIARNGPRCGVYTVLVRDTAKAAPHGFNFADLEQSAHIIEYPGAEQAGGRAAAGGVWRAGADGFVWKNKAVEGYAFALDRPPAAELSRAIVKTVGEKSKDAMRVEVPFDKLLRLAEVSADPQCLWQADTRDGIRIPLGPKGAKKLQYLTLGKGTEHHAVLIGMPGSGKSNLMHIIITTMAMMYPPDEAQLYLIDFKQGVGFKRYAQSALPHARVIAIESEREFGLSVLKGLDEEMERRGAMFRELGGIDDIAGYRKQFPDRKLPRILLLVDEFQEFFSYEDQLAREAGLRLDRLIRLGRYAGIHVMLGSQSLANRSALPTGTLGQVAIRIAMKCSEADARLVMADDNPQARLLSRPGEAIYNAANGLIEGNNFFQAALFTDEDRHARLDQIAAFARQREGEAARRGGQPFDRPIVFEGNEPSRLEGCAPLKALLGSADYPARAKGREAWLGEPVAIRPPTSARLRRQGASHLLVVTRNEEEGVGMMTSALLSLAAQAHPDDALFYFADLSTAETPWEGLAKELADMLPHRVDVLNRHGMAGALKQAADLVERRLKGEAEAGEDVYFFIQGLHRARDLREEEPRGRSIFDREGKEPPASELFARVLREGPECGVHVVAWCDAYANVKRTLGRGLGEFALRVAGAMSSDDSMGLLDDSAASKLDRPHRAVFFDDERPGRLEKFRPYAIPERGWMAGAAGALRRRAASARGNSAGG